MRIASLIILVLISNCIFAQNKKLVIKHTDRNSRIAIKKEKYIGIWSDSVLIYGDVISFDSNYFELRIWGRDKSKMEYFTDRMNWSRVHKLRNKEGWYVSDSLTKGKNKNDTLLAFYLFSPKDGRQFFVLYRSTDIVKFSIGEIDSIEARKVDGVVSAGPGVLLWPLMMISTPIWNYDDDGHYNWETLGIFAGLSIISWSVLMINKYYVKWRMYDFRVYKVNKLKPIHGKKISLKRA
jgi:hypothetical protein